MSQDHRAQKSSPGCGSQCVLRKGSTRGICSRLPAGSVLSAQGPLSGAALAVFGGRHADEGLRRRIQPEARKGTSFKWLGPVSLSARVLPNTRVIDRVPCFTARASGLPCPGPAAGLSERAWHLAGSRGAFRELSCASRVRARILDRTDAWRRPRVPAPQCVPEPGTGLQRPALSACSAPAGPTVPVRVQGTAPDKGQAEIPD